MSRIGKMPIVLPGAVKVVLKEGQVQIQGPKGTLFTPVPAGIECVIEGSTLLVKRADDLQPTRALHGLTRSLLANAVKGVTDGYKRELDIVGVGYKAAVDGQKAIFNIGYSHPIELSIPPGITVAIEKNTHVVVEGFDKQLVGQVAANIHSYKKPDPYKGKGVMYTGEKIIRKAGKAAK